MLSPQNPVALTEEDAPSPASKLPSLLAKNSGCFEPMTSEEEPNLVLDIATLAPATVTAAQETITCLSRRTEIGDLLREVEVQSLITSLRDNLGPC